MKKVSFVQAVKSSYKLNAGLVKIKTSDILYTVEDIPVVYKNDAVWGSSSLVACAGKAGISDVIFVDDYFLSLSEEVKLFVLYHEIGHIVNKHNETIKNGTLYNSSRIFKLSEKEIEADEFAVKNLGSKTCINGLKYLFNNLPTSYFSKREIKKRLDIIENC